MRPAFTDYYRTLGVHRDADPDVIAAAYRALSRRHHPDKHGGAAWAHEKQNEINTAFSVLSDPYQRAAYDRVWDEVHRPPPPTYQPPPRPPQPPPSQHAYPPPPQPRPPPEPVPRAPSVLRRVLSWAGSSLVLLIVIRSCVAFSGAGDEPRSSQSVRSTVISEATNVARASRTPAATESARSPRPTEAPTETGLSRSERLRLCSGWNEWLDRTEVIIDRADSAQATYEALPVVGRQDLLDFASEWRRIAARIQETDPPPAAELLVDALYRHAVAVVRALEADAAFEDSDAKWAIVARLYQESEEHMAEANLTCAGYYYRE